MYALLLMVSSFCLVISAKSVERAYEHPPYVLWGEQPEDESYEVRRYNTSVWASTNVTAFSENEAAEIGFGRLYRYITGNNKRGITMLMTTPVTVDIHQSPCVFCPRLYVVSFYLPSIYQADAPEPSDENILIVTYQAFLVYTRRFYTHPRPDSYLKEAHVLFNHLAENNVTTVEKEKMVLATYDPPFKTFLRENEAWLYYYKEEDEHEYIDYIEPDVDEEGHYIPEEDEEGETK